MDGTPTWAADLVSENREGPDAQNVSPPRPSRRGASGAAKAAGVLLLVVLVANFIASHGGEAETQVAASPSPRLAVPPSPDLESLLPGSLGAEIRGYDPPSVGECGRVQDHSVRWTPGECAAADDLIVVKLVEGADPFLPDAEFRRIVERKCPKITRYFTSHTDEASFGFVVACWAAR